VLAGLIIATSKDLAKFSFRYFAGFIHVIANHGQLLIAISLSKSHDRITDSLIFRNQRLQGFDTYLDQHFASITVVPGASDETPPLKAIQNVRDCARRETRFLRKLTGSHRSIRVGEYKVDTLRIGGVQPYGLRYCLVQEDSLSTDLSTEIP